jgi:hypothetical protein
MAADLSARATPFGEIAFELGDFLDFTTVSR